MSSLITYSAAVCAAVAGWFVRGALAVQSSAPQAPKVGVVPPWWELALFILAGVCLILLLRPSRDRVMPLFITAVCIAPWIPGVSTPALLVWTGPLALAVWVGALAATALLWYLRGGRAAIRRRLRLRLAPRHGVWLAGAGALLVFGLVAFGARSMVPGGDEPHYLVIVQSLLYDGDLKIENNHTRRDYAAYFSGDLKPDYLARGQNGEIYSVHAPGLPALVAPAFAIGGYQGVVVWLLLLAAAGVALTWKLAFDVTGRTGAAWYAAAGMALATPIAFHAFTVYPDGVGGILTLTGIWALIRVAKAPPGSTGGSVRAWCLHGSALALLPWVHTRLSLLAGVLGLLILLRLPRTREGLTTAVAFLAVPVISAAGWFAHFWVIYGTPNPEAPYGTFLEAYASWAFVPGGLAGVPFDQQFGILLYAPVFLMAAAGWLLLWRRHGRLALELLVLLVPYLLATTHIRMWWGGWSAPGRFSVPVLWVAGLLMAVAWAGARTRAARGTALAALGISAWATATLAWTHGGRLAYNVRDGYSLWLEWLSPLGDLPLGLPSFFRWHGMEHVFYLQSLIVLALFGAAFVVVWTIDRWRRPAAGTLALLLMAAYVLAGMTALSLLWRMHDASGVRPAPSQIALLLAAAEGRRTGIAFAPGARPVPVDAAVGSLRIESPPRLLGGDDPPALVLPGWFPAGSYALDLQPAGPGPAPFEIRPLRLEPPVHQGDAAIAAPRTLSLPVDVPAIIVRGANLAPGTLRPLHVADPRERFGRARVRTVRRHHSTVVWFLEDGHAFNEPEGFWVRGGSTAEVVLQPDDVQAAVCRIQVRNGAAGNEVVLEAAGGDWREPMTLAPGEVRNLEVPMDPRRGAALLRITTSTGFRPSEVEPGSTDTRVLGVWVEVR
jgi:hypothetical protein